MKWLFSKKREVYPREYEADLNEILSPPVNKEMVGRVSPSYTESKADPLDPQFVADRRCVALLPNARELESYRVLRTRILHGIEKGGKTLMVTSALAGEGKTLTAINLSFTLAKEFDRTVLLVDCDLKQQAIQRTLGIRGHKGLADYLLDGCPLRDLIIWPGVEKMSIISGERRVEESSELLGSSRMRELVVEMKTRYPDRLVVFDVPPVLAAADALVFAPLMDYIVLVVRAGRTPLPDIQKALEILPREKILGTVLNRCEGGSTKYYDYYYSSRGPLRTRSMKTSAQDET